MDDRDRSSRNPATISHSARLTRHECRTRTSFRSIGRASVDRKRPPGSNYTLLRGNTWRPLTGARAT